ncbi:MAG TPA: hypothetical protein VFI29_06320 [Hanamia sp.]|nr:hypothetical protein [Hanamia sp.]
MKEYYVYGLIDPRTNLIFYIGKGKGKRVLQHFKEKLRVQSNTEKLQIIEEIQKAGLEADHIIISENLNEASALLLERLLVYRFGRKIFGEGILSNIVPGGKWSKESSYFINPNDLPSIETISTEFPELIPALEKYPHAAKDFNALQYLGNLNNKTIYEFEIDTKKSNHYDVDALIQKFNLGYALDVINGIKNTSEPIYAFKRFWQKFEFTDIENISKIPFQDFDIIDFCFIKDVNKALLTGDNFLLTASYPEGNKRTEVSFTSGTNEVVLTYYLPDGNKKHCTKYIDDKLDGTCLFWHPNGQLKEEILYSRGNKISKKCFYPDGNPEKSETRNEDGSTTTNDWYQNGQLRRVFKHDATISPSPFKKQLPSKIGSIWTWDYSENGILLRETKANYPNGLGASACGYEKLFYETGELKTIIDYTEGIDKKKVSSFDKDGKATTK